MEAVSCELNLGGDKKKLYKDLVVVDLECCATAYQFGNIRGGFLSVILDVLFLIYS